MTRSLPPTPVTLYTPEESLSPPIGLEAHTFELQGEDYVVFEIPIPDIDSLLELSATEREIVRGVIDGWSNKEIAASRGTSHHTVANQLRSIYTKLGVAGRIELVRRCSSR